MGLYTNSFLIFIQQLEQLCRKRQAKGLVHYNGLQGILPFSTFITHLGIIAYISSKN